MKKARWLVVVLGDWTGTEDEDFEVILKAQKKWIKDDKSGKWPKKRLELWRFVGPEGSAEVRLFKGWTCAKRL